MKRLSTISLAVILLPFFVGILYASGNRAVAAVSADFQSNVNLVATGNSVNFLDLTTGDPVSWAWTFVGGTPSTWSGKVPPAINYNTAGEYTVILEVEDGDGNVSVETKTAYIDVDDYPSGWDVVQTGSSHLISIPQNVQVVGDPLSYGDFVGVFYLDENSQQKCGGFAIWDGTNNKVVTAFGDDMTTDPEKEGFDVGEGFLWKVYYASTPETKDAMVAYNQALPNNDGTFIDNGLSSLTQIITGLLEVSASADPAAGCEGDEIQLNADASGGSGSYTYSWTSVPAGFTSSLASPTANPTENTVYTVEVDDGIGIVSDDVSVTISPAPSADAGADQSICMPDVVVLSGTAQNYNTIQWLSSGTGTFDNSSNPNTNYNPSQADIDGGSVLLTLVAGPIDPCQAAAQDDMSASFVVPPTADVGFDQTICEGETVQVSADVANYCELLWSSDGDGSFDNASGASTTYYPGTTDIASGTLEICIQADACDPCTVDAFDCFALTIQRSPTASVGGDATICEGETFSPVGDAENYCALMWSTTGDGSFSDDGILTPEYTPGSLDILAGTVELCLDATACDPCVQDASDCLTLSITKEPLADVGENMTLCEDEDILLNGNASNYCGLQWTTDGDGTFGNTSTLATQYFSGANDLVSGQVELCLTASACDPCLVDAFDCIDVTIIKNPTADAGPDATICEGEQLVPISSADNYCDLLWTSFGDGTFVDPTAIVPQYTPGTQDIENGQVEICIYATACDPCTADAEDCMQIIIQKAPTVFAGNDEEICEGENLLLSATAEDYCGLSWNTDGDGTFDDAASLGATYYPGIADISGGIVEICLTAAACNPCTVDAFDCFDLTIQKNVTAFAGSDATICESESYLIADATANYYSVLQWSSVNGTGTFNDGTIVKPTYSPSLQDYASGCVTLQIDAQPISPCSVAASDMMELCFQAPPEVNTGGDATICDGEEYQLLGAAANHYQTLQWLSSGDGVFDDASLENPVYTNGANDLLIGSVTLTVIASAIDPCIGSVQDEMTLSIQPKPEANAGDDATVAEGEPYTNTDASVENQSNFYWETSGDGAFDDANLLNVTYTPGGGDELAGSVELCLTAEPIAPCQVDDEDCLTLVIGLAPNVYAGSDATVCEGNSLSLDEATADNYLSILWTTNGDGSFNDPTLINPEYTPGLNDISTGTVELCITAQPVPPSTVVGNNCMVLTIQNEPAVAIGNDQTICQGESFLFNETVASNFESLLWTTTDGTGQFSDVGALKPTYFPSESDYALGCIAIQAHAAPINPCTTEALDDMNLCFQLLPSAIAGDDATICESDSYDLSGQVTESCGQYWETEGDGSFDDEQNLFATYYPGSGDIAAGFVEVCLYADPCNPCTIQDNDCLTIFIQPEPTVDAGADQEICEDDTFQTEPVVENTCAVLWTSTGDGEFDNPGELLATYTPGANDIANGSVTLCIEGFPCNPCDISYSDCMTLEIVKSVTVFAGVDETICEGETLPIIDATVENQSAIQWFTSDGSGTFSNGSIINPTYTPSTSDYLMGCITLGVQAQPNNPCVAVAEDFRSLCFQLNPVLDAGLDLTICETESFTMAPDIQNACGYQWTTIGDGTFDDDEISDATYFPGSADIENGGAELCITVDACVPCGGTNSDCIILTIQKEPEAYAGDDAAIAEGQSYTLSQSTASYYSALVWTTNGDGEFDNAAVLNPVYTPGSGDENNGMVTLCLIALPVDPCQTEAADCMQLEIGPFPVVNAGTDQVICENETLTLSEASADNYLSLLWTTSGEGTFDDPTDENPTYFPSVSDISADNVELCVTAQAIPPATGTVSDCMNLTFQLNPIINAGPDATVCEGESFTTSGANGSNYGITQWITTTGTGDFINPLDLEATYVPTFLDYISGCITLQITAAPLDPCSTGTSDVLELCFQAPPEANAGNDQTICETGFVQLEGSINNACAFDWTTSGDGVFSNPQNLNAEYYPGSLDMMLGFAELCLNVDPCDPCTLPGADCMIVTIQPAPEANAGPNAEICEGDSYQLSGSVENACGLLWETEGDGTFDDETSVNANYILGIQDIQNGFVELCLTGEPCSPCDVSATDCMLLSIQKLPMAYAGDDQTICEDNTYQLIDASAENFDGLVWTTNGTGQFDNPQLLNPVYTPSAGDIDLGCVMLTLEALPINTCTVSASDDMELCFQLLPEVNAGGDVTICEGDTYTTSIQAEHVCGFSWTTNGDGEFVSNIVQNPTYIPGDGDLANGSVELCVLAAGCDPCTAGVDDCITLFFQPGPMANAGPDDGVLAGNPFVLEDAEAENYSTLQWQTDGDGTFNDPTVLNPTYNHGPEDEANFGVELCLTAQPIDPCLAAAQDCMVLQIGSMPVITAGPDITICEENQYELIDPTAENYLSIEWSSAGDGTFNDVTLVNPVYAMGPNDLANGSVELCMLAQPLPPAIISATDCMILSVVYEPTVSAGDDVTLCGSDPYHLQAFAENYCEIIWTTNGDGAFDNNGLEQPLYTPGPQDMATGSVQLCIDAMACNPCQFNATDCMTMFLLDAPEADAGDDVTICESKSVSLSGTVGNNCDFYWETNGDGEFDDISSLTPTYTPGDLDNQNETVELCLVALPCEPCTTSTTDCMTVTLQLLPQPDPGPDASVCIGDNYDLDGSLEYGNSFFWQTNGTGTFGNSGSLETTYYPSQSDYSNGSVSLTIFAFPVNPCTNFQTESMTLSFVSDPTVDAGEDATICSTEPYTMQPVIQDACELLWETGGDGTFDDASIANAVYYPGPGDAIAGTVEICLTGLPCGSCETPDTDCMTLTVIPGPTADAGDDATICENEGYQLIGGSVNNCGIIWQTSGDGTFDDPMALNAYYTPGILDLENELVVFTLTADACSPCSNPVTDDMILSFAQLPGAIAGADGTILAGEDYLIGDASVENALSFSWSSNGDGEFNDANIIAPVYTPGDEDILNGLVTLCLTAQPFDPCLTSATDCLNLAIGSPPVIEAGPDATICEDTNFPLDLASADNYSSLAWTSSGDGTFSDATAINPVYFPGNLDISNGAVVLCIDAGPVPPATQGDQDCMTLTIVHAPLASAGANADICVGDNYQLNGITENDCGSYWTTNGDGTFDDITLLDATYFPGPTDQQNGSVELCIVAEGCSPCDDAMDCLTLSINMNPTVDAGDDATVCEVESYQLSGLANNACGVLWETTGDGVFSNESQPGATYLPGASDLAQGSVELCLTAFGCGSCDDAQDCMTIFFQPAPESMAGADVTICEIDVVQLSGGTENACGASWYSNGDGNFDNPQLLDAKYTPGLEDISDGSVELCLIAQACDPCVAQDEDCLTVFISSTPFVDAGDGAEICENDNFTLSGFAEDACGILWTTSGTGTFDNPQALDATYFPSFSDLGNGTVDLCLTADACNPCTGVVEDCLVLTFTPLPSANAGIDQTICADDVVQLQGGVATSCGFQWSTNGDGSFENLASEWTTYIPGQNDIATGNVEICLEAYPCGLCDEISISCITVTIEPLPQAFAGEDNEICVGETFTLGGEVENACDWLWYSNGDGSFDLAGNLDATYTPGADDIANGTVELCLESYACNPCTVSDIDCLTLTLHPEATATAGDDQTICESQTVQLSGSTSNDCDFYWTTNGDGQFDDPSNADAFYTPGSGDIAAGSVDVCFTAVSCTPCESEITDCLTITILANPTADAGEDQSVCEDQTVALSATVTNACGVTWSTNGFGSFDDSQSISPVYTPGIFDIGAGTIEICVTAQPCDPCSVADQDCLIVTFIEHADVNAGEDDEACMDAPYQLNGTAENVSGVLWSTSGDGLFDDAGSLNAQYTAGPNDASLGEVELTLTGIANDPCTINASDALMLTLYSCQVTVIPAGWSGISTWVDPVDTNLEDLFAPVIDELIILQTMENSWWPAENFNTIGTYDYLQGYKIKVTEEVTLNVPGNALANQTLNLAAGWNLIPVLSSCDVDVEQLFDGASVVMVKEVAGWKLYWPNYGINTLEIMNSGSAYYVYMETAGSITFPACDDQKSGVSSSYEVVPPAIWMDVNPTATSHIIAVPEGAIEEGLISRGDFIGVVDADGISYGFAEWTGNNVSITVFGDDPVTDVKDGFEVGEMMRFVILEGEGFEITDIDVVYDEQLHADGLFVENGISALKATGSTGIADPESLAEINVYPNPVKHNLIIELGNATDFNAEIVNMQGQLIWSGRISGPVAEVDFSGYNNGVYLIRITGNGTTFLERITKQ